MPSFTLSAAFLFAAIAMALPAPQSSIPSTSSSTANGLLNGPCLPVTVIYARGTSEPGNIGSSVGPALLSDLQSILPSQVAFQGVNYTADVAGDEALGKPGGLIATSLINQASTQCPKTQIFVSGYSEGALVAHNGVAGATAAARAQTAGVLVYGDPFNGTAIAGYPESKVKTYCATGDAVCKGEFAISAAHLSYVGADTTAGAAWIKQVSGL